MIGNTFKENPARTGKEWGQHIYNVERAFSSQGKSAIMAYRVVSLPAELEKETADRKIVLQITGEIWRCIRENEKVKPNISPVCP